MKPERLYVLITRGEWITFSVRSIEEVGPKLTTIAFDYWHEQMPHPRLAA